MNTPNYFVKSWIAIICGLLAILVSASLPALAVVVPASAGQLEADPDYATSFLAVDAYVEEQMDEVNIPGLGLAVVQGDQVAYVQGYGKAGPGKGAVTPQTPFLIGSTTKAFTALAIMQMVEAGQVELDAPVQTYLPWFRVKDEQASALITLRHLLNQTSGFTNAAGTEGIVAHDLSDNAIETSGRRLAEVELGRAPGEAHEYSNLNFNILGLIVQTVSGQSYESYVQEHIFDPLEMRHSFASQDEAIQDGMANGYLPWMGLRLPVTIAFNRGNLPSGYLIISAEDMAHYLVAQLNDGRYGSLSVLSPQSVTTLHQAAVPTGTPEEFYGMGWYAGTQDGEATVFHAGDNANFQTFIFMLPDKKLGVAVMTNVNGMPVRNRADEIARGVAALVQGKQPQPHTADTSPLYLLAMGSGYLPVVLSVLWIAWTAFRFVRRQKKGVPAQRSFWWYFWVIVLPLVVDIVLILTLLVGIPMMWGRSLALMSQYFTDLFTLMILSALALFAWGLVRTVLTLRQAKHSPRLDRTLEEPLNA